MQNKKRVIIIAVVLAVIVIAGMTALRGLNSQMTSETSFNINGLGGQNNIGPMSVGESMDYGMPSGSDSFSGASIMESKNVAVDNSSDTQTEKKVIKNGSLTIRVDRVNDATQKISEIAKSNGGEIFSSNFNQSSRNIKSGSIIVRVPTDNFEKTFNELKGVASLVVRESTSGDDVTEQYTDLQSRLKNKQAEEQSLIKILDRAGKITEVLEVTRELSRVRGEIEVLQGRIRLMDSQIDMATIDISLSEDPDITISDSWRPLQVAKDALNNLIKNVQQFINFLIVLIIRTIPVLLLYLAVILVIYWLGKKIYNKIKPKSKTK